MVTFGRDKLRRRLAFLILKKAEDQGVRSNQESVRNIISSWCERELCSNPQGELFS